MQTQQGRLWIQLLGLKKMSKVSVSNIMKIFYVVTSNTLATDSSFVLSPRSLISQGII